MASVISKPKLDVVVDKPTPYTFDLGLLLANDPNPTNLNPADLEASLATVARDGAQSIINQLLTTCAISSSAEQGVTLALPPVGTPLPREKAVPQARPPTKWEQFAAKRGIRPKTREQRRNLRFDEATGDWERRWGYKGANKKAESDWLVEVDARRDDAGRDDGTTVRGDARRERKDRAKRNDRRMRKNMRQAGQKR